MPKTIRPKPNHTPKAKTYAQNQAPKIICPKAIRPKTNYTPKAIHPKPYAQNPTPKGATLNHSFLHTIVSAQFNQLSASLG